MESIEDASKLLNTKQFLIDYTDLNINGGVRHRLSGKGTNITDKKTSLRPEEEVKICDGLEILAKDLTKVVAINRKK